jgi:hypothetical protein
MEVRMEKKERQESKTKYEQALKKLRESGLVVEDVTQEGAVESFLGGIRPPSSVPEDEDDGDSANPAS